MRNQRAKQRKKERINIFIFVVIILILGSVITLVTTRVFKGKYSKNNVMVTEEIKLNILNEKYNEFDFELLTLNKKIKGKANKKNPFKAVFKKENLEIEFDRKFKNITIKSKGDLDKIGIYSSIDVSGEYIKGKPVYKEQNRMTKIFYTEKMQKDLKALIKEDYAKLENIVLGAAIEDIDYEKDAKIYEVSKNGAKENAIILVDNKENFYIGYYDGTKLNYMTNNNEYKDVVPTRIKTYSNINNYDM